MADTQARPTGPVQGTDDQLCHQVCCQDENKALCGRDVSEAVWKPKGQPTFDCVVCDDLNALDACPLFKYCLGSRGL